MSVSGFEEFAAAVAEQRPRPADAARTSLERVTVLGGGADARMLAALCLAAGAQVTLFSAYGKELAALRAAGGITIRGDGPVGTYQVDRQGAPSIRTTAELDEAVNGADVIFLTGPVHKQRTYAMVLADHLQDGQLLVLAPGRTLGAAETAWLLRVGGRKVDVTLVEAQGLPYWHVASGSTLTLSAASASNAATLPADRQHVLGAFGEILPNATPTHSTVHTGFADGSGLVEVPALLLGGPAVGDGQAELPVGGVALPERRTFRTLIGPRHLAVMQGLARERVDVARAFGVRDMPSLDDWLDCHAGTADGTSARPVPSAEEANSIVRCATIGSLAPLLSAARVAGRSAPLTEAMIALASAVLDADIASAGRKLEAIGIGANDIDSARRILDAIAAGAH